MTRKVVVSRTKFGKTIVPGGWIAHVPTISIARDDARLARLSASLMRMGASPMKAEEVAREACQDLFTGSWTTKLKMFIGRTAGIYIDSFGSMEGFDPERVEGLFIPGADDLFGQRKAFLVREELTKMREELG